MSKIKNAVYYIFLPLLLTFLLLTGFFLSAVCIPQDVFHSSYQSMIQNKYDNLVSINEPKIILIGGSSLGFGLHEQMLSEATGYPVVNLGLHAGFGVLFNTEISKANIGPGDIVLLGYEYNWMGSHAYEMFGADLILSGIDSKLEMYTTIPLAKWGEVIGYLPTLCEKKATYKPPTGGAYSRFAFDENGHMTIQRDFRLHDYHQRVSYYGAVSLESVTISEESIQYLNDYKAFVEKQGASVYFIAPPLYEKAKVSSDKSFEEFGRLAQQATGIPYLSNPLDYVFGDEYMYDTIYHCNTLGEIKRTELLIADLQPVLSDR